MSRDLGDVLSLFSSWADQNMGRMERIKGRTTEEEEVCELRTRAVAAFFVKRHRPL